MSERVNRQWILASRPAGEIEDGTFELRTGPVPEPKDGEILVRNLYLSFDPTQRGWINDAPGYVEPVQIGEVMRAGSVGRVEVSHHPDFAEGDMVAGAFGWQDYAISDGTGLMAPRKLPPVMEPTHALSVYGITGLTAYFGMLDIGEPKEGETVVVSGAAGATGSVAGQIAKIKGCRVIGIAGGPEKCGWLTSEANFDEAIDYKSEDVAARLHELCPNGVDVYFDNVGGDTLDAVLANLALKARVVLCGAISTGYTTEAPTGPSNYLALLLQRARMEGFIILDYAERFPEAVMQLAQWVGEGRIVFQEDLQHGLENAPATLKRLFNGQNRGKQLLEIDVA